MEAHSKEGTIQVDPLAMPMCAIAITPFIHLLNADGIKQASYVDNATAGGSLKAASGSGATTLMNFLVISYLNAVKTWLILKEHHLDEAKDQFKGTHNHRKQETSWYSH